MPDGDDSAALTTLGDRGPRIRELEVGGPNSVTSAHEFCLGERASKNPDLFPLLSPLYSQATGLRSTLTFIAYAGWAVSIPPG